MVVPWRAAVSSPAWVSSDRWWLRVEPGMPRRAWISPTGVPATGPWTTTRTMDRRAVCPRAFRRWTCRSRRGSLGSMSLFYVSRNLDQVKISKKIEIAGPPRWARGGSGQVQEGRPYGGDVAGPEGQQQVPGAGEPGQGLGQVLHPRHVDRLPLA